MSTEKCLSVLIVDDNEMTRTILRMMIQGEEFNVVGIANNGQSAIEQVKSLQPDIVCLDILMPGDDGLRVLEKIKTLRPQTQVLMVTASRDRETVKKAVGSGADGFIVKPFNSGTVLDALLKAGARLRG